MHNRNDLTDKKHNQGNCFGVWAYCFGAFNGWQHMPNEVFGPETLEYDILKLKQLLFITKNEKVYDF